MQIAASVFQAEELSVHRVRLSTKIGSLCVFNVSSALSDIAIAIVEKDNECGAAGVGRFVMACLFLLE